MLLLEADAARRVQLERALRAAGLPVRSVGSVAEIERWPVNEAVVTDYAHFTPWWKAVGADHVVVLVDNPQDGVRACLRGASAWIDRRCGPGALVREIQQLARSAGDLCHFASPADA